MDRNVIKIQLTTGISLVLLGLTGFVMNAHGQLLSGQAEYEAKLAFCYDLLEDISDDFGWFWQNQKKVNYNNACGELTGYIDSDAVSGN